MSGYSIFHCLTMMPFTFQVFGALSQLECGSEVWERVLLQSLELLRDSNDEPLAATIDFIFKAASQCQHLPEAVRSCIIIYYFCFLKSFICIFNLFVASTGQISSCEA